MIPITTKVIMTTIMLRNSVNINVVVSLLCHTESKAIQRGAAYGFNKFNDRNMTHLNTWPIGPEL